MIIAGFRVVSLSLADATYPAFQRSPIDFLSISIQDGRSPAATERTSSDDDSQPCVRDSHPWPSLAILTVSVMSLPD
jgi:hypothetical protein